MQLLLIIVQIKVSPPTQMSPREFEVIKKNVGQKWLHKFYQGCHSYFWSNNGKPNIHDRKYFFGFSKYFHDDTLLHTLEPIEAVFPLRLR